MSHIGPIMLDIASSQLSLEDKQLLTNKLVGGVIIFRRNFESADQVFELTQGIKQINPNILIAVDQEGGRVQRFSEGFSPIPAMGLLGQLYRNKAPLALEFAAYLGELMASEVQSVGCDISFAPVLDLGFKLSKVIGDRAFSTEIDEIILLGGAFIEGMNRAGMSATGKHFPGHGSIEADSHIDIPYDPRSLQAISERDLQAFTGLKSNLAAIMPAHIVYQQVDEKPAGFSSIWLQKILRQQIGFDGVIFSDDLSMKGAEVVGGFAERAKQALSAGCDMVLVCNNREATLEVIESFANFEFNKKSSDRLSKLFMCQKPIGLEALKQTPRWQQLQIKLIEFNQLVG